MSALALSAKVNALVDPLCRYSTCPFTPPLIPLNVATPAPVYLTLDALPRFTSLCVPVVL